jgi:hypothetical protein
MTGGARLPCSGYASADDPVAIAPSERAGAQHPVARR